VEDKRGLIKKNGERVTPPNTIFPPAKRWPPFIIIIIITSHRKSTLKNCVGFLGAVPTGFGLVEWLPKGQELGEITWLNINVGILPNVSRTRVQMVEQ